MKTKFLAVMIVISFLFTNYTFVAAQTIKPNNVNTIEVDVQGCNITFDKSTSKSLKLNYYGDASSSKYNLKTSIKNGVLKIDLNYIGSGLAPTVEEGGIVVKIPEKDVLALDITGTGGAGITLNNINIDTKLKTEDCAVLITNDKAENKMIIDSKNDYYEIKSAPPTKDFKLKADGCAIDFKLSKVPDNLKFKLTDKDGDVVIPKNWKRNFSIGSGKPNMIIENVGGCFELYID